MNAQHNVPLELNSIQPIYLAKVQIFSTTPGETNWTPLDPDMVPISIAYDSARETYRIISADTECKNVILNKRIYPDMEFLKSTPKFGQWTEKKTGLLYGIGFASERELETFSECLDKTRAAVVGLLKLKESAGSHDTAENSTTNGNAAINPHTHQGQGEGTNDLRVTTPQQMTLPSWQDFEQRDVRLAGIFEHANRTCEEPPVPSGQNRPSTFRVPDSPRTTPRIEDLIVQPPVYKPPIHFLIGQTGGTQNSARDFEPTTNSGRHDPSNPSPGNQGQGLPTQNTMCNREVQGYQEEVYRLKSENTKLTDALVESSKNVKKWEVEMDSLRAENAELVKTMNDMTLQNDELRKEMAEVRQECNQLKDYVTSSGSRAQIREMDEKVQGLLDEKARLQIRVEDLQNNLDTARQQLESLSGMSQSKAVSQAANEAAEYYRRKLTDTQKELDETLAANSEGKKMAARVDGLFVKSIHDLIGIHGQLRKGFNLPSGVTKKTTVGPGCSKQS